MSPQRVLGKMLGFKPDFCGFDTFPDGAGLNRHQPQVHMEPEKSPSTKREILLEKTPHFQVPCETLGVYPP